MNIILTSAGLKVPSIQQAILDILPKPARNLKLTHIIQLDDLTALNLVPFLLVVHYNREKYREKLAHHIPTASRPIRYVHDDKIELLGDGPEILASSIA